jgi:predicted nucleic acid-binding protein
MAERRAWCSCLVIDYLVGAERSKIACEQLIDRAKAGDIQIVVSALALAEVAKINGDDQAEKTIQEFFRRDYVIVAQLDWQVAEEVRKMLRTVPKLKAGDAVHLATAVRWKVPILETWDIDDLVPLNGQFGSPAVTVRTPIPEGQARLPATDAENEAEPTEPIAAVIATPPAESVAVATQPPSAPA